MPAQVARLYSGEDSESHFEDLELSYTTTVGRIVPVMAPATGVEFRRSPDSSFFDWHRSPLRQYMVTIEGRVEFATGDGTKRIFNPGDLLLVEDVTGKGHTTRAIGEWVRIAVAIQPDP